MATRSPALDHINQFTGPGSPQFAQFSPGPRDLDLPLLKPAQPRSETSAPTVNLLLSTGLHFPGCFEPLSSQNLDLRVHFSVAIPVALLDVPTIFLSYYDSHRPPRCPGRRVALVPYPVGDTLPLCCLRAVDCLKRRARLFLGFRGSLAQHGFLTNFLYGTDLSSPWQAVQRGLGSLRNGAVKGLAKAVEG